MSLMLITINTSDVAFIMRLNGYDKRKGNWRKHLLKAMPELNRAMKKEFEKDENFMKGAENG